MSKIGIFISIASMFGNFGYNPEYENLTDEEKAYMDYQELCLMDSDKKFTDACFEINMLVLELASRIDTPEEPSPFEVYERINKIQQDFSDSDKLRLDSYMDAVVHTIGIYSEESIKKRKLKKKGND